MSSRAAAAGASFLGAHPLFLKSCSRPTWLGFVREHFPNLAADYARRYAAADFIGPEYRNTMATRIKLLCRQHGLGERSSDALLTREIKLKRTTFTPHEQQRKAPARAHIPEPAQAMLFAAS